MKEVRGARAPRALSKVEYSVVFNVNSYQLDIISKKLSDEIFKKLSADATAKKLSADATIKKLSAGATAKKLSTAAIFIKAKHDKVTISTVENYVGDPSATSYVAKIGEELPDEELPDLDVFAFKVSPKNLEVRPRM